MTTTDKHQIHVSSRHELGKKVSNLRQKGLLPANIFGGDDESLAISVKNSDMKKLMAEAGESALIYLQVDDKKTEVPVLVEEAQLDPVSSDLIHVSFKRVRLDEKVRSEVPIVLIGETDVKEGNVLQVKDVIEVEALPTDLPEQITLDISGLTEIGQSLSLMDAQFDSDKVQVMIDDEELQEPLVVVQEQREEEVEEEPETESDEDEQGAGGEEGKSEDQESDQSEPDSDQEKTAE